jgi:hypothetical protein
VQILIAIDLDAMHVHGRNKVMIETNGSPRFRSIGYVSEMSTMHMPYRGVVQVDLKLQLQSRDYYDAVNSKRPIEDQTPVSATAQIIPTKQLENKK